MPLLVLATPQFATRRPQSLETAEPTKAAELTRRAARRQRILSTAPQQIDDWLELLTQLQMLRHLTLQQRAPSLFHWCIYASQKQCALKSFIYLCCLNLPCGIDFLIELLPVLLGCENIGLHVPKRRRSDGTATRGIAPCRCLGWAVRTNLSRTGICSARASARTTRGSCVQTRSFEYSSTLSILNTL